jgi:hypothetical protein
MPSQANTSTMSILNRKRECLKKLLRLKKRMMKMTLMKSRIKRPLTLNLVQVIMLLDKRVIAVEKSYSSA